MEESGQEKKVIRFILFTLQMDKSEYDKLVEEANRLADEGLDKERLKEVCKKITDKLWGNTKKTQEEVFKEFDKHPPFS